jgi:hypothetical protein
MTPASYFFAFLVSTLFGAAFHLWQGGGARWLLLYLLTGWVGFAAGQVAGQFAGLHFFNAGELNLLTASAGCVLALFLARWLATRDTEAKE